MADHLTEEEQIEALKRWWRDNWLSVVVPIAVAIIGYVGWSYWQGHRDAQAQAASDQYQQLVELVEVPPGTPLTDEQKSKARSQAVILLDQHGGSMYGDFTNLLLARLEVDDKRYDEASTLLRQVVMDSDNPGLVELARARLAKVLINLGKFEQALDEVRQAPDTAYKSLYAEIRGDAYLGQGKTDEAHTAYQQAFDQLDPQQFSRKGLLQLKLDSTAVAAVDLAATAPTPTAGETDANPDETAEGAQ